MLSLKVLVIALCSGLVLGFTTTTSGTGGTGPCGGGPNCISPQAQCIDNDCVCQPPYEYKNYSGRLDCFKGNTVWGRGATDPHYKTFDVVPFFYKYVLPCRVLISHTETNMKVKLGPGPKVKVGKCECKVHSWNAKYTDRGKIFVGGVDVTCMLNHDTSQTLPDAFTVRIAGTADGGVYTFQEWGSLVYDDPSPPLGQISIIDPGIVIQTEYDMVNNVAYLDVKACGVRVGFTPYDRAFSVGAQPYLPGFTVGINCAHQPEWLSPDVVMFTGPVTFGGPAIDNPPGMNFETYFMIRALTSGIAQTQPDASGECTNDDWDECDDDEWIEVEERCSFLFTYPLLSGCIDNTVNADILMTLFNLCVATYCENVDCTVFSAALSAAAAGCNPSKLPDEYVWHFNGTWCPP